MTQIGSTLSLSLIFFSNNHIPDEQITRDAEQIFDVKDAQIKDKSVSTVIQYLQQNQRPSPAEVKNLDHNTKQLLYEWRKLKLSEDGTLRRISGQYNQIVLPLSLRHVVYSELHTNMGHLGPERVVQLARERFFWPHMQRDITNFVTRRCRCVKQKPPAFKQREPLTPIHSTTPFEIISIDYMHLEKSSGGYEYVLVIVDHFTRYAQAYATKDKSGKTAARLLFNAFIFRYGYPIKIHHDDLFCMIKVVSLKVRCFAPLRRFPILDIRGRRPIIRNVTERLRDTTVLCFQCCEHCPKHINPIGETICQNLFMCTIIQDTMLQDFHHSFFFLVGHHDCPLTSSLD